MNLQNRVPMNKTLIVPKQIICVDYENRILTNHAVEITDNIITNILPAEEKLINSFDGKVINEPSLTLIPGFVQTHVHLCQTLFRGLADDLQLLDWLQLRIFPFENAHNKSSLRASAKIGINELLRGGTTTLLDMGTLRHQEEIFDELIESGIRAIAGKCMMDVNDLFPSFQAITNDELDYTYELAKNYHNSADGRIKYGFAPRFVLSATEELLKETKEMMKDFVGSIYHTHSSENKNECAEVRKRFNKENIEYFNSIGILDDSTVLAHCVHLNDDEVTLMKNSNARVSHCPSSNLKLGSGVANIPRYLSEGISVSLGADGAPCNNNLSQFSEMKLASLIQKPIYGPTSMDAKTVFRLATIEGAKALHIDNETGSIEPGKKADLVLLNLESPFLSLSEKNEDIYSNIVYTATKESVVYVMTDGKMVVNGGKSLIYDDEELYDNGKKELKELLNRL